MWQGGDCPAYSQRDKTECIGNRGKGSCLHKHLGARERKHRARRPHCKSVQHDCHSEPYRAGQGDRADSGRVRFVIRLQRRPPPSPLMTRGSPSILMPGMLLLYIQHAHCSAGATYAKPPVFAVRESGLVRFAKPGPRFERKPADKRARSCTSQQRCSGLRFCGISAWHITIWRSLVVPRGDRQQAKGERRENAVDSPSSQSPFAQSPASCLGLTPCLWSA